MSTIVVSVKFVPFVLAVYVKFSNTLSFWSTSSTSTNYKVNIKLKFTGEASLGFLVLHYTSVTFTGTISVILFQKYLVSLSLRLSSCFPQYLSCEAFTGTVSVIMI